MNCTYVPLCLKISIKRSSNSCPWQFKEGDVFDGQDILPKGMCPFLFNAIFPYFLTLSTGGWFSWVKPGEGVIVQCPNPEGALEVKVFLGDTKDEVHVEVLQARSSCSKEHKKGDTFIVGPSTFTFCPKALDAVIPYLRLLTEEEQLPWAGKDGKTILQCPNPGCGNVQFIVEKM